MSRASSILLIFTALALLANHVSSEPPTNPNFQYILCDFESGSYSYDTDLRTILTTLQTQAYSSIKFYSTSSGADSDTVYGQYYCRGDIYTQLCGDCVQQAAQQALSTCALAKGGIVWYQECTLRYSDKAMYGVLEAPHPYSIAYSSANVSSNPEAFSDALGEILNGLIEEAVNGSDDLFATGEEKVNGDDVTVYGLVQCSPDMSRAQCETCLREVYGDLWTCCGEWPALVYAMYPSCLMMYDTEGAFYYSAPGAPTPFLSSPPAPSPEILETPPPPSLATPPSPSTDSPPPPLSMKSPPPSTKWQPPPPSKAASPASTNSQPPPPSKEASPPSTNSQPPPPSKAASPPLMNSQPPPPSRAAPPPLMNSQPPLYAPSPLISSPPPPSPDPVTRSPPSQVNSSGSAMVGSEGMKVGTITAALVTWMLII